MKIDFYISSLSGGGAENVLIMLAEQFTETGNQVSITSLEKRKQFYDVSTKVKLYKKHNGSDNKIIDFLKDVRYIHQRIIESKADISISFLSRCNILLLLVSFFSKRKIVVCDRNNPLKEHSKKTFLFSCLLYRRANKIVVQTEQIKQMYPSYLQKKLVVLENPLNTKKLDTMIEGVSIEKENVVISIGRLEKQKDFKTLIKAFHAISKKYAGWTLKIFGVGDMELELQRLIESYGETKRILLCGHTKEPFVEMKKSKIFVLSTFYEGFPNVLCEAMYAGLPCISTDCISGPRELINNGENGLLVPIGDVIKMERALEILIQNTELREKLGKKATKDCCRLKIDNISEKWLMMLSELEKST